MSSSPQCSPAALSIYQTVRLHQRERIFVHPLSWTSRHLELLQCSFTEPTPAPPTPTAQSDYTGDRNGLDGVRHYFAWRDKYSGREDGIERLLSAPECPLTYSSGLYFYLGSDVVKLTCGYLRLRNPELTTPEQPVAAYIDRGHIYTIRKDTLRNYRCRRRNPPVHALYQKKWKQLNPTEPLHDPYIVALLIALAQLRRKILKRTKPEEEANMTMYPSQVLCSFQSTECIYLYSTDVLSSLLDKFDHPAIPPSAPPSISIHITTIPLKPYDTLRGRLFDLMLPGNRSHSIGTKRKLEDGGSHQYPRQLPRD